MSYDTWKTDPGPQYDTGMNTSMSSSAYHGVTEKCADCEEVADYHTEIMFPFGFSFSNYYCNSCNVEVLAQYL